MTDGQMLANMHDTKEALSVREDYINFLQPS
jgi:hypothetical protein